MTEFWDKRAKQFVALAGFFTFAFLMIKFAKYFSEILIIIGISILIAYLLITPVDFLARIVRFRSIAVMLVYLIIFVFMISLFAFLGPKVAREITTFSKQIPDFIVKIEDWTLMLQAKIDDSYIPIDITLVAEAIRKNLNETALHQIKNLIHAALGTFHTLFYILVTLVLSYYFLLDGRQIIKDVTKYLPHKYHIHRENLTEELDKCLRGFYGGMVKLAAINACVMFATYILMKLPYSILLALWHFLACIIPTVGGWIGIVPACLVIAFTNPEYIWVPLVVYEGFTRLIKDNFITPHVMGDAIGMHPVIVLIAILVGLKTAGLVGVLFALPIFGVANVTMKYLLETVSKGK